MPITTDLALLPAGGPRPLGAYLAMLASGQAPFPDLIAVPADAGAVPGDAGAVPGQVPDPALDELLPVSFADAVATLRPAVEPGESAQALASVDGRPVRVLLLEMGDRSPAALRRAGADLGRQLAGGGPAVTTAVTTAVTGAAGPATQAFAEGVLLGGYGFRISSAEPARAGLVLLLSEDTAAAETALHRARLVSGAAGLARDLANQPALRKDPQWLADEAVRVTEGTPVRVRTWSQAELAATGFGGILAVGGGSARPPRLIEMSYDPGDAPAHVVVVGKGITFDSGGLSIKDNDAMKYMKGDMAAGGAIIAMMPALAGMGVRHRVTALIPAAENMPSGAAYRPSDVITQYGGTTVEVRNTDAEGRIVLADALAYAADRLAPDYLIDIATLTGAAREALGRTHGALYATDEPLARALLEAGEASGDRLWRMPLEDDYLPLMHSEVAALANVPGDGKREAGSIMAALFLREFTAGLPWAHLDMAAPSRSLVDEGELTIGATGFGARLLLTALAGDGIPARAPSMRA